MFSEYIEGSSNNKALEIYNGTGAAIDLAANAYNVQMFFNGNPVSTLTINLTGSVRTATSSSSPTPANAEILAQADQTNAPAGSTATTPSSCARAPSCST